MSKHTPGPWATRLPPESKYGDCAVHAPRLYIGVDTDNSEADARLIAAAPDLLEALIMIRDADNDCEKDGLQRIPSFARGKIDAAIAKAEGPK